MLAKKKRPTEMPHEPFAAPKSPEIRNDVVKLIVAYLTTGSPKSLEFARSNLDKSITEREWHKAISVPHTVPKLKRSTRELRDSKEADVEKVAAIMRGAGPMTRSEVAKKAGLEYWRASNVLRTLRDRGRATVTGFAPMMRFALKNDAVQ